MNIPEPDYEYDIKLLRGYYEQAIGQIATRLQRLGASDIEKAFAVATLADVKKILSELDDQSAEWVAENMEKVVRDGIVRSLVALGLTTTTTEAKAILMFSALNKELIKAAVADMQSDLLQVTQNIDRRVRQTVRDAMAETMRENLTAGVNGTRTLKAVMFEKLDDATKQGIVDAAGRKWRPQVYVEMAVRTKMMRSHMEATINDALGRGVYYGRISRHGAKDACRNYEGKIIKLLRDAPGDYPFIGELPRREIFHPNCKHLITPVRKPELYENR